MKYLGLQICDRRRVTILLPPGTALGSGGARLLVRYAQLHCGAAPWGGIYIDLFRTGSGEETLLIARPAVVQHVAAADYALPLIHKYFTD